MRLARLEAAAWCNPDGALVVAGLNLLQQDQTGGVDQQNSRGLTVDDRGLSP
jgi:hypothetical protein